MYSLTGAICMKMQERLGQHEKAIMQCVIIISTRYHTFSLSLTPMGHNEMRYHNFNMLPHALLYILSQFSIVWGLFATGNGLKLWQSVVLSMFIKFGIV